MNVAVLGASSKPQRYSYKAVKLLQAKGHTPVPVHPFTKVVDGLPVYRSLSEFHGPVDTISVYLSPLNSEGLLPDILACSPRRVIFNPGTENPALMDRLNEKGVEVVSACTLVLLTTGAF